MPASSFSASLTGASSWPARFDACSIVRPGARKAAETERVSQLSSVDFDPAEPFAKSIVSLVLRPGCATTSGVQRLVIDPRKSWLGLGRSAAAGGTAGYIPPFAAGLILGARRK
jgi:hypothetical protein